MTLYEERCCKRNGCLEADTVICVIQSKCLASEAGSPAPSDSLHTSFYYIFDCLRIILKIILLLYCFIPTNIIHSSLRLFITL